MTKSFFNYLHVVVEEDISQLEVPVDDLGLVDVLAAEEDLVHEVARLRLRDGLPPLVQLHERPPPTELENDVDKVGVLEVREELDDELVGELPVELDLLRHLLALVRLHEEGLGHDLPGEDLARGEVLQFVAFRESALKMHQFEMYLKCIKVGCQSELMSSHQSLSLNSPFRGTSPSRTSCAAAAGRR